MGRCGGSVNQLLAKAANKEGPADAKYGSASKLCEVQGAFAMTFKPCSLCAGKGTTKGWKRNPCHICKGSGALWNGDRCSNCGGSGDGLGYQDETCSTCGGSGQVPGDIKIPPKIAGSGNPSLIARVIGATVGFLIAYNYANITLDWGQNPAFVAGGIAAAVFWTWVRQIFIGAFCLGCACLVWRMWQG